MLRYSPCSFVLGMECKAFILSYIPTPFYFETGSFFVFLIYCPQIEDVSDNQTDKNR